MYGSMIDTYDFFPFLISVLGFTQSGGAKLEGQVPCDKDVR